MATWQEADAKLKEIRANMLATNSGFRNAVFVVHDDGSTMLYQNAFARRWEEYYLVFTEHQGYHWFHHEEVRVMEFKDIRVKKLTEKEEIEWTNDMALYKKDPDTWWAMRQKQRKVKS